MLLLPFEHSASGQLGAVITDNHARSPTHLGYIRATRMPEIELLLMRARHSPLKSSTLCKCAGRIEDIRLGRTASFVEIAQRRPSRTAHPPKYARSKIGTIGRKQSKRCLRILFGVCMARDRNAGV